LGGHLNELGAFYVDCDYAFLSNIGNRFVAFAGPLASLLAGLVGMFFFDHSSTTKPQRKYFLWHFATVNLMIAAGYLLFSGVLGIGDLGLDQDGVFYQAQPEWLYRVALIVLGLLAYYGVILLSLRKVDSIIGGAGEERIAHAQRLSLTSYLTGGVVAVLIGLLNQHGSIIVLIPSITSCLGGTSGLVWMIQMLDRKKVTGNAPFALERSWEWIVFSVVFVLAYAILLGPTIYLK
jgi:hypothetical protein